MRENDGLTLKEFEAITGICYSLTSRYENGKKKVSPKHREIIISFIVGEYMEAVNLLKQEKKGGIIDD
ncbi:helix-turn-helix domain-containing protein [Ureibacillus chungkukjangi]|uniref:helix-turn-helix domain-containing protein n=1 Tax=Ureibacillus chungkukjangi TaxID=1202712 RepID=UPI0038511DD4